MNSKCMELVAAGWCTRKWKRLDQTLRILTSGDLGLIRLEVSTFVYGVNQENLEAGGSPRFPTTMIESISTDLLSSYQL